MLNLLVADDNLITLDFFAAAMRRLGWHVIAVTDGSAAVDQAAHERFDVLLLDARMPIMDGPEALANIRTGPGKSAHSPALATTASTDREIHDRLLDAGFAAVLPKPISIAELTTALDCYARHDDDEARPLFDEVRAHAVVGGDRAVVEALRGLLLAELERLPGEITLISHQLNAVEQLDERLHRLAASAGFCGAVALQDAVRMLQIAQHRQSGWSLDDVARFTSRCEKITGQLRTALNGDTAS